MANTFLYRGRERYSFLPDYTVLDLETTGFHQSTEIIEIGALRVRDHQVVDRYSCLVSPRQAITPFISQLTGIRNEMVKNAKKIEEVLPDFLDWLGEDVLVGQNIEYDLSCIYRHSEECGLAFLTNDYADTLTLSRVLLPELTQHKLSALCAYFSIPQEKAHRALDDSLSTMRVYESLKEVFLEKEERDEEFAYHCARISSTNVIKKKKFIPHSFDKNHPFYAKRMVFIGALEKMPRSKAEKKAQEKGAIVTQSIDHHTYYVIIGSYENTDKRLCKANALRENGLDIHFLTENEFYKYL